MRHFWITCAIPIALILMAFAAGGQTLPNPTAPRDNTSAQDPPPAVVVPSRNNDDWNRVRALAHDEEINVWSSRNRHVRCLFTGATDDFLFCEPKIGYGGGEYRFNRADVDRIRLEQGEHHFKTTVAVAALTGVIAGAALPSTNNSAGRVIGGLAGGLVGGFAGLLIAGPVAIFVPGHLVYQRPHDRHKSQDSARSRQELNPQIPQQAQ